MNVGVLINHAIAFVTSPLAVSLALIAAGLLVSRRSRRGIWFAVVGLLFLWFMASGLAYCWLGLALERQFPPERVETLPTADAIVILGGGMGGNTNTVHYPELYPAADRVVHAARLWKAGRAPVIMASGTNELVATVPFLLELGVPQRAIRVENKSGNTEENARFVAATLKEGRSSMAKPKVLLVTSAWHMRRALLMFRKYAPELEIIPAACDYEATVQIDQSPFWKLFLPTSESLCHNSYMLKEIIGYYGYKFLR